MTRELTVETLDHSGSFTAYCAEPEGSPKAAVIVIQEIFGVNPGIRAKCDSLARDGYLAVAPDLFWRSEAGAQLDPDVPEQFQEGFALMQKLSLDEAVKDIEALIRTVRPMVSNGKVGAVGYCLGGRLAFLTATRTDIDATVGYYGGGINMMLGEAHAIAKPLMLHFAEQDHFIDAEARKTIHAGLDSNRHVTIHEYAGVDHGFATEFGARRADAAAKEADARTAAFFTEHLA